MRRVLLVLALLAAAVLLSLALARVHPFGDPQMTRPHPSLTPVLDAPGIPPDARAILTQKCADCHSEQTRSPWYGRFAPASWLMERDIVEARERMDLSRWQSLPPDEIAVLKSEIAQQARSRTMPPLQYRLVHTSAALTDADVRTLTAWTRSDMVAAAQTGVPAAPAAPGDATRGKATFEARCTGCHSLNQNREGPRLAGVVGRTSGTAEGFTYSAALKKAAIRWDTQSLDRWLTDPESLVPDTDMDFNVGKAQERSDIIAYLQASKQVSR